MNWKLITIQDLRLVLAEDEILRLDRLSVDESVTNVINDTIAMVSDVWRGALSAKGMVLDPRPHFIPSTYVYWVLVHARYAVWSRFPNSGVIAIDDVRKSEYDKALEILKEPYLDVPNVEWGIDKELSAYSRNTSDGASLITPMLAFPDEMPYIENFIPEINNYKPFVLK